VQALYFGVGLLMIGLAGMLQRAKLCAGGLAPAS
jgi:hypothetical protein